MSDVKIENGVLKFRPKARLLQILGHELISDEVIAVLELAKNSYDADASEVKVTLTDVTKKAGQIEIRDNGHGMTRKVIEAAWMEPARNNKRDDNGERSRTKKFGRLPLGEKGVGRFSTDKLGLHLEIISRFCEFDPRTKEAIYLSPEEVVVVIEGRKFTDDAYLDEIECSWKTRIPEEFTGQQHGTILRISELRNEWNFELIKKIRIGLARLSSPIERAKDFELIVESNEFGKLSGKVENPLLRNASYFLDGLIDDNGIMTYTLEGPNGNIAGTKDLKKEMKSFHITNEKAIEFRKPVCGPFRFRLYTFERDKKFSKKYGMDKEKLDVLNALCGVSIYRDNFRVLPYGEQGNDWLTFDRRRVQNPGKILGNERVIGYIEISQSQNPKLQDKTNREGLIEEGLAFADLRDLAREAADYVGLQRWLDQPHKKRSKEKVEQATADIQKGNDIIGSTSAKVMLNLENASKNIKDGKINEAQSAISSSFTVVTDSGEAINQINEGKKKLLEELAVSDDQIANLIALSGIGMTAERMTHEFSTAIRHAEEQLQVTLGILNRERDRPPEARKAIEAAIGQLRIVSIGLEQMEPLYYSKRKYTELLDVAEIARNMSMFFSNALEELSVKVDVIEEEPKLEIDVGKGQLMQVFNNLFDNALYWLKFKPKDDGREIKIKVSGKTRTITFADNGQGINDKIICHLFEPFVTTKPDGRGLGLYIIYDILQNYKSEIEVLTDEKLLSGANFKITFPEV